MRRLIAIISAAMAVGFTGTACRNRAKPKPIPIIVEAGAKDGGGTAALAMVLAYHGRAVTLDELRPLVAVDELGTSNALSIIEAAKQHGLVCEGLMFDFGAIDAIPRASILHWEGDCVVWDGRKGGSFRIIHAVLGPQTLSSEDFRRLFTGVALVFDPDRAPTL